MTDYSTVSLPRELHERIKRALEEHPEWGFSSVAEFIRASIRAYEYYDRILEDYTKEKG